MNSTPVSVVAQRLMSGPSLFFPWLADGMASRQIMIDRKPPFDIGLASASGRPGTGFSMTMLAAQRIVLGSDRGIPFIGLQDFDFLPLMEIAWSAVEIIPRDRMGSAWIRISANPLRFAWAMNEETHARPLTLSIPTSPELVCRIPGIGRSKGIVFRRILAAHGGHLKGVSRQNAKIIRLFVAGGL